MTLELSSDELRELKRALDLYLGEMHDELIHTDDREYRAALRATYERLERIDRRIHAAMQGGEVYA